MSFYPPIQIWLGIQGDYNEFQEKIPTEVFIDLMDKIQ